MDIRTYFHGKRILVTGGSSGIGLAFASRAAGLGAEVVLFARRAAGLDAARTEIERVCPEARVDSFAVDVADANEVNRRIARLLESAPVDILINSAGLIVPGRFVDLSLEDFQTMIGVNFLGTVNVCKAIVPHFMARRTGHVINVSSLAGVIGIYGYTAYAASKFAIVGFSQALRAELWPLDVRVSVVMPPDTDTPMLAFERAHRPVETDAIAGAAKTLSADQVAQAMIRGAARGCFEIYCDPASRILSLTQGALPGAVRWFCDRAQRGAQRRRPPRG